MSRKPTQRVVGRGERVQPGLWRLRLPLPWPGVPHCNAWAIAAGDGVVLVDTGAHEPGSIGHLERALDQVGLRIDHIRLVVCTHAHADHCGQAPVIRERAGCEVWMHPDSDHLFKQTEDPEAILARRFEIARSSGVPEAPLRRFLDERGKSGPLVAPGMSIDRELVPGVRVETDLGAWDVIATPGHAPSHVCLHQPDRRLLLSGDHLMGRVTLHFEPQWADDSVQDFLTSLDAVEALDVRLALSGHGRPFTDIQGHIDANRELIGERLDALRTALATDGPATVADLTPKVYGDLPTPATFAWFFLECLALCAHLGRRGEARREPGPERHELWRAIS